jgi:hypothetical protein
MFPRIPKREADYRDYKIKMQRRDLCWTSASPQHELSFPTFATVRFEHSRSRKEWPWLKQGEALIMS